MRAGESIHRFLWLPGAIISLFIIIFLLPPDGFNSPETLIVCVCFWPCYFVTALAALIYPFFLPRLSVAAKALYWSGCLVSMILLYHYVYVKWDFDGPKTFLM